MRRPRCIVLTGLLTAIHYIAHDDGLLNCSRCLRVALSVVIPLNSILCPFGFQIAVAAKEHADASGVG